MQIKLVVENFEEDSSVICLKSSSSISSWIIDFYFTEIFTKIQPKNIITSYDMWMIYRTIQPGLSLVEFWNLCKNKLKGINNNDDYNKYLNRCGLIDIIDIFHQCQFDSNMETIIFSIKNIKNNMDRLFFEYLLELPTTSCGIYDIKAKLTTIETSENLLKLIKNEKSTVEEPKNDLKHMLCTYLSLVLDTRNEHALIHCLLTSERVDLKREIIVALKNENLTNDMEKFFDFIEQLRMIIEENECANETFRKLLELICKQLPKNLLFNQSDSVIEELCQCFQTTIPLMNYTSPVRSASSEATLGFLRSIAYLCAKQTIDLPVVNEHHDVHPPSKKCRFEYRSNPIRKYRSLDLSIIHETSFEESDSIIVDKPSLKTIVKRQPLREIDVNSFNIENEKHRSQKPIVISLVSDGDKENHPMIIKKRPMIFTKNDLPNKKQKKINPIPPEPGQKMITSFFQSTN